ncbi:MAG: alpha/beta hydrolase family protein [Candidatus Rokuibacteriota bacterium]
MPFVDPTRVVIGGQSRGGILSVAYAGQHPQQIKGVINLVFYSLAHIFPGTQPRELCRVPGGRGPGHVSRPSAGARRPLHLATPRSLGPPPRNLPQPPEPPDHPQLSPTTPEHRRTARASMLSR